MTATFSVLSDTINGAKATLEERHNRKDISTVICQLQKSEGEKLNLTAALHLERLRLRNSELDASLASGEQVVFRVRVQIGAQHAAPVFAQTFDHLVGRIGAHHHEQRRLTR